MGFEHSTSKIDPPTFVEAPSQGNPLRSRRRNIHASEPPLLRATGADYAIATSSSSSFGPSLVSAVRSGGMSCGRSRCSTVFCVTRTCRTPCARHPGSAYIESSSTSSTIERRPRAPVLLSLARRAIALTAPLVKLSSISSAAKRVWYCLSSALRGRVITWTMSASESARSFASTGKRPTNSGRKPYRMRSPTCSAGEPTLASLGGAEAPPGWSLASKPMTDCLSRSAMMRERPVKAPPQMKRMLVVSMATCSARGVFRPPRSGTLTTDPSSILSSACCTPSPETSRVMAMASALRASLSISSMYTIPTCVASAFWLDA
mmetsp:Transcript_11540/g.27661  ORF Transcript_11540/g.27661 Transcript_11540/m.27661 type:complete len:319 (-) Transcript_11540:245-1201(-)